jgi:hypothetical protein
VTRFLYWCGAVDSDLLSTRSEHYRFANQGVFVCLIGVLAGVSFTLYLTSILGGFSLAYLPVAVLWATLIFFLDRSIVAEPSYGDLSPAGRRPRPHPPTGTRRRTPAPKAAAYAFRVVVALMVAWLIGDAIVLAVFRPEITTQLDKRHAAAFDDRATAYLAPTADQITGLQRQRDLNDQKVVDLREEVGAAYQEWQAELGGDGGTGQAGVGPEARQLQERYSVLSSKLPGAVADLRTQNDDIDKQITEKSALVAAVQSGDPAQVDAVPELRKARADIYGNQGWIEQEAALQDYLREHGTSPTIAVVPWLVRGILLAVDLLPLMLKLGTPSTIYGRRLRGQAARICYEGATHDQIAMDLADREVSLHHSRAELRSGVARQQDQWQVNRWIGQNAEVNR